MIALSTSLLARACRIFMDAAYPDGPRGIPAKKQPYYNLPADAPLADYLPPVERAVGVVRALQSPKGEVHAFEFRLGSAHFPHLKLRVQQVRNHADENWVFMVDTHDHFPRVDLGADEEAWRQLQQTNRALKERIEASLEQEGFMTPNKLLRVDLA